MREDAGPKFPGLLTEPFPVGLCTWQRQGAEDPRLLRAWILIKPGDIRVVLKKCWIIGYFQKQTEIAAVPTKNKGTDMKRVVPGQGWHGTGLIFGIMRP